MKPLSDVQELSVGNIVYDKVMLFHRIDISDFIKFKHPNMGGNYGFYPIPLDEEWLIKLGFKKDKVIDRDGDSFDWFLDDNLICIYDHTEHGGGYDFAVYVKGENMFKSGFTIQWVHQLQNFVKSLTGKNI